MIRGLTSAGSTHSGRIAIRDQEPLISCPIVVFGPVPRAWNRACSQGHAQGERSYPQAMANARGIMLPVDKATAVRFI